MINSGDLAAHFAADLADEYDPTPEASPDAVEDLMNEKELCAQAEQAWTELETARMDFWSWSAVIAENLVEQGRGPSETTAEEWRKSRTAYDAASARHWAACDRRAEARAARMAAA